MYAGTGAGAGDFKVLPDDEIGVIAAPAELLEPIRLICFLSGSGNALRRYEAKVWQQDKHEKEGGKKCCFRRRQLHRFSVWKVRGLTCLCAGLTFLRIAIQKIENSEKFALL